MKTFPYSDDELLEIATSFKKHLKNNADCFRGAYPLIDHMFICRFKALFYEVQSHPAEPDIDSTVYQFQLELDVLKDQIKNFSLILRFYLQKAFPYDSGIWQAFGYCELEKVMRDYQSVRRFTDQSVDLINLIRSELKSANCPDTTLEEIEGLAKQFGSVHDDMAKYLERKESRNRAYRANLNELFKLMNTIHEAAYKCFINDPILLRKLTFPPKQASFQD